MQVMQQGLSQIVSAACCLPWEEEQQLHSYETATKKFVLHKLAHSLDYWVDGNVDIMNIVRFRAKDTNLSLLTLSQESNTVC